METRPICYRITKATRERIRRCRELNARLLEDATCEAVMSKGMMVFEAWQQRRLSKLVPIHRAIPDYSPRTPAEGEAKTIISL